MRNLIILLVLSLLFVGCGDKDEVAVKKATNSYVNALKKGDLKGFRTSVTANSFKEWAELFETEEEQEAMMDGTKNYMKKAKNPKFSNIEINGNEATLTMDLMVDGENLTDEPLRLLKEKGKWKVINLDII